MHIHFHKLTYKNILSTGNSPITIDLERSGTTLISGKNGNGKSTWADALVFGLFGTPYRKIVKGNLVNSINKKNLLVEVEFSTNGSRYLVKRGIKPNVFEIFEDGELIEVSSSVKDYQKVLDNILRINYKSFCQVVIQGSANAVPFMQLTAAHRREVVEDLLDLQVFSVMNSLLKERVSDNKSAISKQETDIRILKERISMQEKHNAEMLDTYRDRIRDEEKAIFEEETNLEKNQRMFVVKEAELNALRSDLPNLTKLRDKLTTLNQYKTEFDRTISSLKKECDFYSHNDDCPTCKQRIDSIFKNLKIQGINTDIEEKSSAIPELNSKIEEIKEKIKISEKLHDQVSNRERDLYVLKTTIDNIESSIKKHNMNIEKLNKEIQEKAQAIDVSNMEKELRNLEFDYAKLLEEKDVMSLGLTVLKDNGIKAKFLSKYIPIINQLINRYLSMMDFHVNFQLDENFEEKITSLNREDFSYMNFSEGEKQRIDLATLFAWREIAKRRNSVSTNLLVLDETLDASMDTEGTELLMKILKSIAGNSSVFVVSHKNETMIEQFDHVIEFVKINNFTHMKDAS